MTTAPRIQPDDGEARRIIRESLDQSLLVEASAGTGKTSEMVRRIVAVLAAGLARIEQVVAVTYTRKAAGELKLRLRQQLDGARGEAAAGSTGHANLEDALARLEEAHVGTIHSFCAEILRERPVEARIDPAFSELSEPEARRLFAQAFRRWAQERLASEAPALRRALTRLARLERLDPRPPLARLEDAAWALMEQRGFPEPWRREPLDREAWIDELAGEVKALDGMAAKGAHRSDPLVTGLRPAHDLAIWIGRAETSGARDYDVLEALLLQLQRDLKRRENLKKGRGQFAPGLLRERVVEERDKLLGRIEQFRRRADADLAALLRDEMWELVDRYADLKRRAGGLDFADLVVRVRDLLRDDAAVRRHLQDRFRRIFVDEFQDTDPLQAGILILLSAGDPDETDWLEATPAPGKLFLVGDPKQSIYRFRHADVVLYQQVRRTLAKRGVGLVHLSQSYRAVRPLQECVNAAFEPEIQESEAAGQPHYVPLEKVREAPDGQPTLIALPVPHPYGHEGVSRAVVANGLPDLIAAFVEWLVRESGWKAGGAPIEARHVCLLFRRYISYDSDTTRPFLHALEAREIPHVLVKQRSLHQREEVETIRTALAAVEWPDDELSVYATLRGALFGLSDSALLRFRESGGRIHPFGRRPETLDDDLRPVADVLDLLARLHRSRNYRPAVETIHTLLEATRAHAGFAVRPAGYQVLANMYRVCDLARRYEASGGISFRGFVEELEAQAERPATDEGAVLEDTAEGVRVMTVHTAKGLEFPVVVLADIHTHLARKDPGRYIDGRRGLCAMPLAGWSPWELLEHQEEEAGREQAEGVRVAYVAATRARDLLVVPAIGDEPLEGSWVEPLHKALYPARENRRRSRPAPGCPEFGETTVLGKRPDQPEGAVFAIRPGRHTPASGRHEVVWWDPALLKLKVKQQLGLRLETVLAEDPGGEAARRGIEQYEQWKRQRDEALAAGSRPEFQVFTATTAPEPPAGIAAPVEVASTARAEGRPSGRRFGTLVHTILRDADLDGGRDAASALARVHGRVLGSPPEEIDAAAEAVAAALRHPLIERARRAERCSREWPILLHLEDGRLLEGVLDLAFLEDGAWTVVDFKSDAHLEGRQERYRRQVEWYVYALARVTGQSARGWLLSV